MTLLNALTKHVGLTSTALGSLLMGLSVVPAAVAQVPSQTIVPSQAVPSQSIPNQTISIPSTGTSVQLSQIRVASTPPAPQNPCPGIYYEAPYNQYVVVPQQCTPNLITQQLEQMGMLQAIRATSNTNTSGGIGGPATPYTSPSRAN
jgi:hypothetical protein